MILLRGGYFIVFVIVLTLLSKKVRKKTKEDLRQLNKRKLFLVYLCEITGLTGFIFSYLAIQRAPVSLVTLVHGTEGLFVLGLAVLLSVFIPKILKEEIDKKTIILKIVSALLMIGGLYLIVT